MGGGPSTFGYANKEIIKMFLSSHENKTRKEEPCPAVRTVKPFVKSN